MTDPGADGFVTIEFVAGLLDVDVRTVRRWMADSRDPLPCYRPTVRTTRIRRVDLEAWLVRRRAVGHQTEAPSGP